MFSAAAAAAFINGLARFALMFLFVFYFQGVQGNSPVLAGVKLAPLAIGMLISSPLAGIWADRRGSRGMAVAGMIVTAVGLALMTTLQRDSAYLASGAYMFIVGMGSGMFNSPNTAAMMGTVAPHRRGIAAGARVLVQNTGAVISIAFRARRSSPPRSRRPSCSASSPASPTTSRTPSSTRSSRTCTPPCGAWRSCRSLGAFVAAARPKAGRGRQRAGGPVMSTTAPTAAADRRARRADRDHPADDPLLRGDRAARQPRRTARRASTATTPRPTSSGSGRSCACATCSGSRSSSWRSCSKPRPRAPSSAASIAGRPRTRRIRRQPARAGDRPHRHPARAGARPPARARAARGRAASSRRRLIREEARPSSRDEGRVTASIAGRWPTLSAGHLFTDIAQGSIPALLPFLISKDHLSYAAASALVLAATISSSVIQPLFGHVSDRLSLPWLMPLGPALGGLGVALSRLRRNLRADVRRDRAQRHRRRGLPPRGLAVRQLRLRRRAGPAG